MTQRMLDARLDVHSFPTRRSSDLNILRSEERRVGKECTSSLASNIRWVIEKSGEFQKNIYFIDYAKAFV